MITYDQLGDAMWDEFLRYHNCKGGDLTFEQREDFYTRLGFAHEALRRAGLILTANGQNTEEG